jgi:UBX domain-containing protein 1
VKIIILGQAFYAGGSERSGQQILGPPKGKDNDKNVTNLFEAARKQGAKEAHDDETASSSHTKKEKPFTGVGYSLSNILKEKRIVLVLLLHR